jgi:iron(III) transport system substrate-binding protein
MSLWGKSFIKITFSPSPFNSLRVLSGLLLFFLVVHPTVSLAAAAKSTWQAEWKKTVEAAEKEGKLALVTPPGDLWRKALLGFQEDYPKIRVDLLAIPGRDFRPRLQQERQAGLYLWDARVGGPSETYEWRDKNIIVPVRPLLLLPEVLDESKYIRGRLEFADKTNQYTLMMVLNMSRNIYINRDQISEKDLSSPKELIQPRWKGKIAINDPRGGAGLGALTVLNTKYGEELVKELLTKQDLVVAADYRQIGEWVVRGRYPIVLGLTNESLRPFTNEGVGLNVKPLTGLASLSVGFGSVQVFERAPHAAAAKVFVNWVMTRKAQERIAKIVGENSLRIDVPPGDPAEKADPAEVGNDPPAQAEAVVDIRRHTLDLARKLLAK